VHHVCCVTKRAIHDFLHPKHKLIVCISSLLSIAYHSLCYTMSFFNQQEYLDDLKESEEMVVKHSAPPLSLSSSPERRHMLNRLADIPEATPGPNAFAQQAARVDKHRLDSNAFYQQEVQKRLATPPTIAHPALRQRSMSDPPTPPRLSSSTTMSPFINASRPNEYSPPLKLVPSDDYLAEPTERGFIEERHEQILHEQSGSGAERTPVFVTTSTFAKSAGTPKTRAEKQKEVTIAELPTKTPKRSILEKLRLNTSFRSSPSSIPLSTYGAPPGTDAIDHVPVKAKAVLGTTSPTKKSRTSFGSSPSKLNIPRSPSKRKGLFSRKTSGFEESMTSRTSRTKSALSSRSIESDPPPLTASTVTKTPPTAFSDPSHYSYSYKTARVVSQPRSEQGADVRKCSIARSQSLRYFDHGVPPTPPTKDTPPEEKAKREAALAKKSSRLPFHDTQTTPSKEAVGFVSTNDRLSPTKFGSYGNRDVPTLVTKPSMYSLHASVVPTMSEATTFEEMKARIDGLGLEGFNMPPENMRTPKQGAVYSPSIYSTEWNVRPSSAFASTSPSVQQAARHTKQPSDKSKSSSSGAEIILVYPELAKDPSYSDITPSAVNAKNGRGREHLEAILPLHGRTHARDHSSDSRQSYDSLIFAHHVDEDLDKHVSVYGSPTSFSHPSAAPSPLYTLPTTTYKPPPRKSSRQNFLTPEPAARVQNGCGLGISRTNSTSPSRRNELFDNAPTIPIHTPTTSTRTSSPKSNAGLRRSISPERGLRNSYTDNTTNVDPQKPSPKKAKSPAVDKLDKMLELLNHLHERNYEISTMRDEMRASNARLGERLAAIETLQRASPVPSSTTSASDDHAYAAEEGEGQSGESKRVSTAVAHDFYRAVRQHEAKGEEGVWDLHSDEEGEEDTGKENVELSRKDTIAELRETNSRLLEMVSGFAERIQSLERSKG